MIVYELPIKKYVIVGSYALGTRYAKDIDVICYKADIEEPTVVYKDEYVAHFTFRGKKIECLLADKQESLGYIMTTWANNKGGIIANKPTLKAIKLGHLIYPNRDWEKYIGDYHQLKLVYLDHWQRKLVQLHRKCTKERFKVRGTPKLIDVSKEDFFDDNVTKYFEHDDIHGVMAHREKPMFTYMQSNPESVECSKDLWNKFTHEQSNQCVMEEAYVIALERHIIPAAMGGKITKLTTKPLEAFKWALMRVCTTLCSGWFREWAINNYFTILNEYNPKYIDTFFDAVESGKIKTLKQKELIC